MLRQRVEFPGDKTGFYDELGLQPVDPGESRREPNHPSKLTLIENQQNHRVSPASRLDNHTDGGGRMDTNLIDRNARPQRVHEQASNNQILNFTIQPLFLFLQ